MTVTESSLYANLHVETSPASPLGASWTDQIADVRDIQVTRGGYEPYIGVNRTEPGSGTITLVDSSATINPGYWVRLRYSSQTFWAGYIENVLTTYRFINNKKYKITTLTVLDWVGWLAQYTFDTYPASTDFITRITDINTLIDPTRGNRPIDESVSNPSLSFTFPSYPRQTSAADMLDMVTNSIPRGYWKSALVTPTNSTDGYDMLIKAAQSSLSTWQTQTFTDGTQTGYSPNKLYYNEIDVAYNTSTVANNIVVNTSFVKYGELVGTSFQRSDSTSISTYGARSCTIDVTTKGTLATNLITHPSFEDYDYQATATTFNTSVEQPASSSIPWSAKRGTNALRGYVTSAIATIITLTDQERINITAGTTYYAVGYAAVYSTTNAQARVRIDWYDDAGAVISTTFGSYVSLSSNRTWYKITASGTAPAGAQRARMAVYHTKTTGGTYGVGEKPWADALYFGAVNVTDSFDGDVADTSSYLYDWLGTPNASQSFRMDNMLYSIAGDVLTDNKTSVFSPILLRVNAQDNVSVAAALDLYGTTAVYFDATYWRTTITGLKHTISINADGTTRWMIDVIVRPTASTTTPIPPP